MANTRGKTAIHGPSATGPIRTTSPAGTPIQTPGSGPHGLGTPNVPTGSGATGGTHLLVSAGTSPSHTGAPISGGTGNKVNAGQKTTVNTPNKKAGYTNGAGVGANTPIKRKRAPRLGT